MEEGFERTFQKDLTDIDVFVSNTLGGFVKVHVNLSKDLAKKYFSYEGPEDLYDALVTPNFVHLMLCLNGQVVESASKDYLISPILLESGQSGFTTGELGINLEPGEYTILAMYGTLSTKPQIFVVMDR